jgi:hypothetical protein
MLKKTYFETPSTPKWNLNSIYAVPYQKATFGRYYFSALHVAFQEDRVYCNSKVLSSENALFYSLTPDTFN